MSSYTYRIVQLESIDESGANLRPVKSFWPALPSPQTTAAIGEKMRLTLQITFAGGNWSYNQRFVLNLKLFGDRPHSQIQPGAGWLIEMRNTGAVPPTPIAKLAIQGSGDAPTNLDEIHRNFEISSISVNAGNNDLDIELDFYITEDIREWIGVNPTILGNALRWTNNEPNNQNDLDNSTESAFSRITSYIEVAFFECDTSLFPFVNSTLGVTDAYARDTNNLENDTFAMPISLKWYDQTPGALNVWVNSTTRTDNYLQSIEISGGNIEIEKDDGTTTDNYTEVTHKGYPFDYQDLLQNFDFTNETTQIIVNKPPSPAQSDKNSVTIKIASPNLASYTDVQARLIRVDAVTDTANFYDSYATQTSLIPKAQPAIGTIDGGVFETPSAWGVAGGVLTIDFIMNGEFLEPGGQYHIMILGTKTDGGDDFVFSSLSPQIGASLAPIGVPTITGKIQTYNNEFVNINDVSLTNFERVKLVIEVDGNTYPTGITAFENELDSIEIESFLLGQNAKTGFYKFPTGPTIGQPEITVSEAAGVYTISTELRSFYNPVAEPGAQKQSFHTWKLNFSPQGFNVPDSFTIKYEQRLRHRGENTTRLPNIRFLDYEDFILGVPVLTEKFFICSNLDEKIVVETEKNAGVDMNQIAMLLTDSPAQTPPDNFPNIEEEESYASAFLSALSSPYIEQVDAKFSDQLSADKAYYIIDISVLNSAGEFFVNTLAYNI